MTINKEIKVRDLTIDDEYEVITSDKSVKSAALKMKELGIPDLVVIDHDKEEKVLGVIADFDIVIGLVAEDKSAENTKVTDVMYTIDPVSLNTPVSVAFSRMRDLDVSVIPVIENKELKGVATITDCWGYLEEKYEDTKGLIAVTNPRFANYAFTVLMTLFYFVFGILSPLVGIAGFIKASVAGSASLNANATYFLFEARGGGFIFRYLEFKGDNLIWLVITGYSVIFLVIGLVSTFAIIQWSYADYHMIRENRNWKNIGFVLAVANFLIIWILFLILMTTGVGRIIDPQIDITGVLISVVALIFLVFAISRDVIFRESRSDNMEG